jgi:FdrA protein
MTGLVSVHKGSYHDSVRLMAIARDIKALPGITEAVVLMATDANKELLASAGFASTDLASATPLDMVVALRAETPAALETAAAKLKESLAGGSSQDTPGAARRPDLIEALAAHPDANLVSIAVPGPYAAYVAHRALDAGRNVFLFSDNVALTDEIELKKKAASKGLLMMGPDCGTAVIGGTGLGFANRIPRGPVGIVGASGTGIQELSSLLDQEGVGVSHAIGTGSRDLSKAVSGVMTEMGLRLLAGDPSTKVIVVVAKHPDEAVALRMHTVMAGLGKPVVVRYLGEKPRPALDGVRYASSLDEAALSAVALLKGEPSPTIAPASLPSAESPQNGILVGLFGGGSLAAEAKVFLEALGIESQVPVRPLSPGEALPEDRNLIVDTGDDFYTVGKPHPMVDQTVRCELIRSIGGDPAVRLLLLDLVLGDGAHPDPAPEIAAAVQAARARRSGQSLFCVCTVCGTRGDPQGTGRQQAILEAAGIAVERSIYAATVRAAEMLRGNRRPS